MILTAAGQISSFGCPEKWRCHRRKNGAGGRTRTGTVLPPGDFESPASTSFATPAGNDRYIIRWLTGLSKSGDRIPQPTIGMIRSRIEVNG